MHCETKKLFSIVQQMYKKCIIISVYVMKSGIKIKHIVKVKKQEG
jgi:hypothetical protein